MLIHRKEMYIRKEHYAHEYLIICYMFVNELFYLIIGIMLSLRHGKKSVKAGSRNQRVDNCKFRLSKSECDINHLF